jgi:hypothetical protein
MAHDCAGRGSCLGLLPLAIPVARYETFLLPPYFEGTHWAVPAAPDAIKGMKTNFADPDSYPPDDRGMLYSFIYFSATHLGQGQFEVIRWWKKLPP